MAQANASRIRGKVKWFNAEKGYGFLEREGGPDCFVHFSEINMSGYKKLEEGDIVEFSIDTSGTKGPAARQVELVSAAPVE